MTCKTHNLDRGGKCTNPGCNFCGHEVKFGGLCAICGKTIEEDAESPVEHIKVTHKDIGITVSLEEAKRLEKEDGKRLLQEKKLSLVVDLDQTILHATWDRNIANWVKERKENMSTTVKDISQFTLDGSDSVYSIKLRPGLFEFLQEMSKKYEMHIYTMGTRSYAEAVVKEIDPKGKLFADRILTRDDNGDMNKKRLERLFPSVTSTVVVLDDRADVWNYSPNLIQIKPYEYFIGIGDINSPSAQPKKDIIPSSEELVVNATNVNNPDGDTVNVNGTDSTEEDKESSTPEEKAPTEEGKESVAKEDDIYSDAEDDDDKEENNKNEQKKKDIHPEAENGNSEKVDNKDEDKKEDNKEEDKKDKEKKDDVHPEAENGDIKDENTVLSSESSSDLKNDTTTTPSNTAENDTQPPSKPDSIDLQFKVPITTTIAKTESTTHLPNIHDTDDTIRVIKKALNDVHNIYFNDLIKRNVKPDVAIILNSLKAKVFKDVNVVFSGVIPLQQQANAEESWIWRMASSFGAKCSHELTGKVTHLVAVNPGTTKVLTARKHGNIKIVSPAWITDSVWNWERQDEIKYFLPFAEISPAESEIENPEEAPLEIDFDAWADGDEDLDDVLNEISSDDEEDDVDDDVDEGSDNDDGEAVDDMFLEDMDAILDSDLSDDDDDYGSSLGKRGGDYNDDDENKEDDGEDDDEPPYKKQFL